MGILLLCLHLIMLIELSNHKETGVSVLIYDK